MRSCLLLSAALLQLTLAGSASAQPASLPQDYRLPPGDAPAPPPVQGPIDRTNPVTEPAVPPPSAAPAPERAPPVVVPPQVARPNGETPPQRRTGRAPEAPAIAAEPAERGSDGPRPTEPRPKEPTPSEGVQPSPPQPAPQPVPAPVAPDGQSAFSWAYVGGALAVLLFCGLALALLARRRRTGAGEPASPPPPVETAPPAVPPAPAPEVARTELGIAFHPERLMMTLVNARLSYRLEIANRGGEALGPVEVSADLIGAHAALSRDEQLDFEGGVPQHQAERLGPLATVTFAGELVLPLASIPLIGAGGGQFFAPLARFTIEASGGPGDVHRRKALFLVGEATAGTDGPVRPVRIDLGPRTMTGLARREIEAAGKH